MRSKIILLSALLIAFFLLVPNTLATQSKSKNKDKSDKSKDKTVKLLKQKKLDNWVFKLKDPAVDPSTVFTLQDGILHIKGSPFGYMRTKDSYSDYKLHVEWRWPAEPTNSGVFVHAQTPDSIWLRCVECQLQTGNAGDFVCMGGADMTQRLDKSKLFVKKLSPSSERTAGEWNVMEVKCKSNTIEVHVNGVLQNKATNVNLSKGSICLQSEGKDIEFRNVYLTNLKK